MASRNPDRIGSSFVLRTRRELARLTRGIVCLLPALVGAISADGAEPAQPDDAAARREIEQGREVFTRIWAMRQQGGMSGDGLGPLFNERSCAACHKQGGIGGGGPSANNVQIINVGSLAGDQRWSNTEDMQRSITFPTLERDKNSLVLHRFGLHPQYAVWRKQRLAFAKPENAAMADATKVVRTRQLRDSGVDIRFGTQLVQNGTLLAGRRVYEEVTLLPLTVEERNTTALFGAGLLDQVPLTTLQEVAAKQPANIRGRPALLPDGRVGRFGWKGQNASLIDFNENACAVELGLQTSTRREASLPPFPRLPRSTMALEYQESTGVDVTNQEIHWMTAFVASLPQPRQVTTPRTSHFVRLGEQHFHEVGCADCHTPNLGEVAGVYSDLLLHRIGGYGSIYYGSTAPPDIVSAEPPKPDEFRTPPLWGVADSAPYMHDGRAATLKEAILAHGIQGDPAGKRFRALTERDQQILIDFLTSLRAPELEVAQK